mgnify:CR=1 FL=1|jgi:hypothetical protein
MVRYPIYIPSKGRWANCKTADFLLEENIPFYIVVESQEKDSYIEKYGKDKILVLPFQDVSSPSPIRTWIKQHSTQAGDKRHWQIDDNIRKIYKFDKGKANPVDALTALSESENFVDQYRNIAIAGLKSKAYGFNITAPYKINQQVYCCVLVQNDTDLFWRTKTPCEDTDYSLQVLASGLCTLLIQVYQIDKIRTGAMKGGNSTHYANDGRVQRVRELQRLWGDNIVKLTRRYGRPQQNLSHVWAKYKTPLEPV